jgi:hypothetical protein
LGAISIPYNEKEFVKTIKLKHKSNKGKIVLCGPKTIANTIVKAAKDLEKEGFTQVETYSADFEEAKKDGLPLYGEKTSLAP